ncbi:MAG: PQQ-binding-like beta-propeller repeat protein [Acidobacteria bacterium]|nr:PQQ-binding-like beta-propeller repeat protein [Acidobacteriota bacterium]
MTLTTPAARKTRSIVAAGLFLAFLSAPIGTAGAAIPPGPVAWVARYNGTGNGWDVSYPVTTSYDGSRVFVAGRSPGSGTSDGLATVAYSAATGGEIWAARYDGPARGFDGAYALAVSPDGGRVYAAGASASSGSNVDFATIAYDAATGSQIWAARYDNGPGAGWDGAASVAVSPNGARVFVTGRSVGTGTLDDFATVAYDAASGSQLWVARYNGPGNDWDQPYGVLVSPDGARVYVAGGSWGGPTSADFATVAYDAATGAQVWVARYDGPGSAWDEAHSIVATPDGARVFLTGQSIGSGGVRDRWELRVRDRLRLRDGCLRRGDRRAALGRALRRAGERVGRGALDRRDPRRSARLPHRPEHRVGDGLGLRDRRIRRRDRAASLDGALRRPGERVGRARGSRPQPGRVPTLRDGREPRHRIVVRLRDRRLRPLKHLLLRGERAGARLGARARDRRARIRAGGPHSARSELLRARPGRPVARVRAFQDPNRCGQADPASAGGRQVAAMWSGGGDTGIGITCKHLPY